MTLQDDIGTIYKLDKGFSETKWKSYYDGFNCNYMVKESGDFKATVCGNLTESEANFIAAAPLMVSTIRRLEAVIENIARRNIEYLRPNDSPAFDFCVREEIKQLMEIK